MTKTISVTQPNNAIERRIAEYIGTLTLKHLINAEVLLDSQSDSPALYVWTLPDRAVLILDPLQVKRLSLVTSHRFLHDLTTVLQGRRVVMMNHRGIFFQIGYWPEPARELRSKPLDLSKQPSPLHVPIGVTLQSDLWLSIVEMDAILIGGARRMGKTNLLHSWIIALLQGDTSSGIQHARLVLFDGKNGVEFARYRDKAGVQVVEKLGDALRELFAEMNKRFDLLSHESIASLAEYNKARGAGERVERIVLIVDELAYALQEPGVEDVLVDLIARGGAVGIHPVLATQRPSSDVITPRLKGNLITRIALPVPDRASSMVILDRAGAESITKTPGRLLIAHGARLMQAQAFNAASAIGAMLGQANEFYARTKLSPTARLSNREARLAQAALERDGWFRVREIAEVTGEPRDWVNNVAKRWQLLGWLTEVQRNASGHQVGRKVTPTLSVMLVGIGLGGQAD